MNAYPGALYGCLVIVVILLHVTAINCCSIQGTILTSRLQLERGWKSGEPLLYVMSCLQCISFQSPSQSHLNIWDEGFHIRVVSSQHGFLIRVILAGGGSTTLTNSNIDQSRWPSTPAPERTRQAFPLPTRPLLTGFVNRIPCFWDIDQHQICQRKQTL